MLFIERELTWRAYGTIEVLPTTKQVQIIDTKEFAIAALELTQGAFVFHIAYLDSKILIYPAKKAQIALLVAKKVAVPAE